MYSEGLSAAISSDTKGFCKTQDSQIFKAANPVTSKLYKQMSYGLILTFYNLMSQM